MTWHGRSASEWMQALGNDGVAATGREREADHVARIARTIEKPALAARVPIAWIAGTASALAAAATLVLFLSSRADAPAGIAVVDQIEGELVANTDGRQQALSKGAVLISGTTLAAYGGDAGITFSGGAFVALSADSVAELVKEERVAGLTLQRGRVDVKVPRQASGHTWSVTTESAKITVVGTSFSVWLADDGGARITCVAVAEGRVRARSSASDEVVDPGQRWSSAPTSQVCSAGIVVAKPEPPAASSAVPIDRARPPPSPSPPPASLPRPAPSSQLREQNELFARMVSARRAGDSRAARALAEEFLAKHPASPLAPEVRRELAKLPAAD